MNINDVFPSKYLKAADLQGHEPTVVINRCEVEALGDQRKLVLYFQGKEKGMICNRTNADRIAFLYSPDTDNWLGKPITLFTDMVSFQGKTMQALRVKPPKPNGSQRQHISPPPQRPLYAAKDHGKFTTSTTQATPYRDSDGDRLERASQLKQPPGQPDVDELPDDEVPF